MPAATLGADRAGSSRAGFWLLQAQAETFLSNFLALLLILVHIFTNWHFKAADGFAFSFQKSCCGLVTQRWPSSFRVVLSIVSAIVFKIIMCFWHQLESGIKSLRIKLKMEGRAWQDHVGANEFTRAGKPKKPPLKWRARAKSHGTEHRKSASLLLCLLPLVWR